MIYNNGMPPFIKEGEFFGKDLVIASEIQRHRLQLLIHSRIYYKMNDNLISDSKYAEIENRLVELQRSYPGISKRVKAYYSVFKDFEGHTGMDFPLDDPWVCKKAYQLMRGQINASKKYSDQKNQRRPRKANSQGDARESATKQRRRLF